MAWQSRGVSFRADEGENAVPRGLRDANGTLPLDALAPPPPIGAEGHRNRMRLRLITAGAEAIADHELLEMVLFLALPRRDTKAIAKLLLARFGSFAAAIAAPPQDLRATEGLGEAGVAAL